MPNRCVLTNQIENQSGAISAQTFFDANWNNPVTALNDASLGYVNGIASDTGSANNYIVAAVFGSPTGYNAGMFVSFIPANTNTGASTLTVSPLTAQSLLDLGGNPLLPGAIQAGKRVDAIFISGAFRIAYSSPPLFFQNSVLTGGAQTVNINCLSAASVSLMIDALGVNSNATITINVTNVVNGGSINVQIFPVGNTQVFKWTGTDSAGNSITDIKANYAFGSGTSFSVDLVNSGDAAPARIIYDGAYMRDTGGAGTSRLHFLAASR